MWIGIKFKNKLFFLMSQLMSWKMERRIMTFGTLCLKNISLWKRKSKILTFGSLLNKKNKISSLNQYKNSIIKKKLTHLWYLWWSRVWIIFPQRFLIFWKITCLVKIDTKLKIVRFANKSRRTITISCWLKENG